VIEWEEEMPLNVGEAHACHKSLIALDNQIPISPTVTGNQLAPSVCCHEEQHNTFQESKCDGKK
jgi:hypothetical protein